MQRPIIREHEPRDADEAERFEYAVDRVAGCDAETDRESRARTARQCAADAQHAHRADRRGNREADARGSEEETGGGQGEPLSGRFRYGAVVAAADERFSKTKKRSVSSRQTASFDAFFSVFCLSPRHSVLRGSAARPKAPWRAVASSPVSAF